jgi:hypothetical protein
MKKILLFIPVVLFLSGCLETKVPDCPPCPEPIVCPTIPDCVPETIEIIKEVPVEVIKEVIVEKEVIKEVPVINEVIRFVDKIVEKIVEVPVEVIKIVTQPAPKMRYTINKFTFNYDKTKTYKLEIASGVAKLYENGVLVKTQLPDKTETL